MSELITRGYGTESSIISQGYASRISEAISSAAKFFFNYMTQNLNFEIVAKTTKFIAKETKRIFNVTRD